MKIPVVTQPPPPPVVEPVDDPYLVLFRSSKHHYTPANWVFTSSEEDPEIICGRNNLTGLEFEGTREEFNWLLRSG